MLHERAGGARNLKHGISSLTVRAKCQARGFDTLQARKKFIEEKVGGRRHYFVCDDSISDRRIVIFADRRRIHHDSVAPLVKARWEAQAPPEKFNAINVAQGIPPAIIVSEDGIELNSLAVVWETQTYRLARHRAGQGRNGHVEISSGRVRDSCLTDTLCISSPTLDWCRSSSETIHPCELPRALIGAL